MRKTILAALAIPFLMSPITASAEPVSYFNPILYADYSDPDVVLVGQDYYMVASSFHFSPGIPVLKSRNLVEWTIIGHVLPKLPFAPEYDMPGPFKLDDTKSKPVDGTRYASGVWAPSIRYHNGLFYVYWATPDEGVFMSTAEKAEGPWNSPVQVIAKPKLEDPCPFWDDDGTAWLVHSVVGAGPLILHRMSPDGKSVLDEGKVIVQDKQNLPILEGPKLYKRNGFYYIFAPIGGVEKGSQVALRSRTIDGPYEWQVVLSQGTTALEGPHQGGWVKGPLDFGGDWFVHFNSTGAFGRIVHLQPVEWIDDWPVMGDRIAGTYGGQPVPMSLRQATNFNRTNDRLQDSDEFAAKSLGPQWSWNHNPDDKRWSLSARPGFLRLTAGEAEQITTARNTLTQILQGPDRRITARLDISRLMDGQRAGLSLFGVRPSWIGVSQEGGKRYLTLSSAGVETRGDALKGKTVQLRAEVTEDQKVRYAYSLDEGRSFRPFGDAIQLARFSWWKGSRPALFTFTRGEPGGVVDVDWMRLEPLSKGDVR